MKVELSINNSYLYSYTPFRETVVLCLDRSIWKRLSSVPIICLNFQSRKAGNPGDGFTPHREGEDHWDHWKALSQSPSTLDPYTICRQIFDIFFYCISRDFGYWALNYPITLLVNPTSVLEFAINIYLYGTDHP